jgi:murein DD-endopeptidase MepM/ murein hydrolase activator NlpD
VILTNRGIRFLILVCVLLILIPPSLSFAKDTTNTSKELTRAEINEARERLFEEMSVLTGIPWYYLAAIDQYEKTLTNANSKTRPPSEGLLNIYYTPAQWGGHFNPVLDETNPAAIAFFKGLGKDGSGDGLADRNNDRDVLYTMASHLLEHGTSADDFPAALWRYYHNSRSVTRITQFAKIYAAWNKMDLFEHSFPLPLRSDYSYRSTWGASRSFGGYRIHEGTDLFARYGVPVRSTCYGTIEIRGWNRFGGWRVGIRDLNNVYHYYAHMSGFNKKINAGDVVKPGDIIGWVGSSGYGKPGTQGKFAPHLHYGLYRDYGLAEWSFDPYPYLRKWEREERKQLRKSN